MKTIRSLPLAALTVMIGALALTLSATAADSPLPQAGQAAPAFTLPSQDGLPISLHDYRGRWVVLYFYPKDMTRGCTIEAHNFQRDMPDYVRWNAVVVGVSVDSTASHREFCAKDGLRFKLLSDQSGRVVSEYGSLADYAGTQMASRNTFLIDPEGKIAKVWTKVDPNVHSKEVLAALATLEKSPR